MQDTVHQRAFVPLLIWSALEGTVCAFALRPTMTELLFDLSGFKVNRIVLIVLLSVFLTILVAGSFACIHLLNDAIKAKQFGVVVQMFLVQVAVALFQVLFLYRKMVDAMAPWLAQQGLSFGAGSSLALAIFAWVAVRGMTWYLMGRSGAPALLAMLGPRPGV